MSKALSSLKETAKEIGVCEKTFAKYVAKYGIPHVRLGRTKKFDSDKVKRFLEERAASESVPSAPLKKAAKNNRRILPVSETKRIEREWGLS